jgi:hypothetical protein
MRFTWWATLLFLILAAAENTTENTPTSTHLAAIDWPKYKEHLDPSSVLSFRNIFYI